MQVGGATPVRGPIGSAFSTQAARPASVQPARRAGLGLPVPRRSLAQGMRTLRAALVEPLIAAALVSFGAVALAETPSSHGTLAAPIDASLASTTVGDASLSSPLPDPPDTTAQRWRASFDAFESADREHPPAPGGVVFVGSSSIRLWDGLETAFDSLPVVVKRGFGGSLMSDCTAELRRLVVPYRPRLVIVYAGDNDLAVGRTPQQVLRSFRAFVEGVRSALPRTRIAFLSIKPSPLREALLPAIRATNALVARYAESTPDLDYIDVYSPMLGADGRPRAELFRADRLHLNAAGYSLWKRVVEAHVR